MKEDAAPNPQKPKRPPGSFLIFMEDFRKEFNLKNPRQPAGVASRAGAEQWKNMKEDEKAPFWRKAKELAVEYFEKKGCYNNPEPQGFDPPMSGSEGMRMHSDKEGALAQGHDPLISGSEGMRMHPDEEDTQAQISCLLERGRWFCLANKIANITSVPPSRQAYLGGF